MNVKPSTTQHDAGNDEITTSEQTTCASATPGQTAMGRLRAIGVVVLFQLLVIALVSGSTVTPAELRDAGMAAIVQPWDFNFAAWEVNALWEKARAFAMQPTHRMDYATSVELVHDYLARAQTMQALEQSINNLLSGDSTVDDQQQEPNAVPRQERIPPLQEQLEALRHEQEEARSSVEQIIERQISTELSKEGLTLWGQPFPPVQFTFVEPPRKLVVSPRARITTEYSQMLDATMSLEEVQRAERAYFERFNSSAYITNIGGLGAFPTMVVDRAPLSWILSTVAHEWTHNYLTLFPLGFNYMTNADFITMNETVAEIVGNELGEKALRTFYPELVPPPVDNGAADGATNGGERIPHSDEPHFDFDQEMHETRLVVDQLLAHGKVEEAEQYMAERRLYFVANGYPLRVLNQAYFAFHGSYGTSAASTSPIGPQMEALRAQSPNLKSFLETVRTFTSPDDITQALAANAPRN